MTWWNQKIGIIPPRRPVETVAQAHGQIFEFSHGDVIELYIFMCHEYSIRQRVHSNIHGSQTAGLKLRRPSKALTSCALPLATAGSGPMASGAPIIWKWPTVTGSLPRGREDGTFEYRINRTPRQGARDGSRVYSSRSLGHTMPTTCPRWWHPAQRVCLVRRMPSVRFCHFASAGMKPTGRTVRRAALIQLTPDVDYCLRNPVSLELPSRDEFRQELPGKRSPDICRSS